MSLHAEAKYGGTKRRKYSTQTASANSVSGVNVRVSKLAKKMKVQNPVHLYQASLGGALASLSTTGTLYDITSAIAQGDDYNNRFSSQIYVRRVNLKGVMIAGTTAGNVAVARITILRAASGLAFAANMAGSYSPVVTGTSLQVYYDKFFTVPAYTAPGFAINLNISVKIKHKQKFSGTGAGTSTGDTVYIVAQSGVASGTGAPAVSGVLEIFFDPM